MAMQETGPVTKLRTLMPDSRHVLEQMEPLFVEAGIPLKVRKNGGTHLEFPKDDPEYPYAYTLQKNAFITALVAERRFPAGFTTLDRLEDYLARANLSKIKLPTSVEVVASFDVFNPLLRVSRLVRQESDFYTLEDLNRNGYLPRVVTSYSGLAEEDFISHNIKVELDGRGGKEEELVHDGDADIAIVTVDKGRTMKRFQLRELGDPVMGRRKLGGPLYGRGELKLVFICNPDLLAEDEISRLLVDKLIGKLQGSQGIDGDPEIKYNPGLLLSSYTKLIA